MTVDTPPDTPLGAPSDAVAWSEWLRRWDRQQEVYIQSRERCYEVMLAALRELAPAELTVLDLAAGPGTISQRVLAQFPDARSVAVDVDPVLLTLGRGALGDLGGRLRWVRADLRDPTWGEAVGGPFDAVLSSTATHWLAAPELAALYRTVAGVLRPGGVLLNFDGYTPPATGPRTRELCRRLDQDRQQRAVAAGAEGWQDWWDALRAEPSLAAAFAERDQIFAPPRGRVFPAPSRERDAPPTLEFHVAALREAGFAEAGSLWQDLHKHLLLGLR